MDEPGFVQLGGSSAASVKNIRRKGFLLDSARCLENRSYYRRFIDFVASRGINTLLWHFTDDQGCTLEFESVPGIASPNAYSKLEMRTFVKYARDRGVDVVPELASLGHCRYLTHLPAYQHLNETQEFYTGMCPLADETRTIIRTLINETAEVFDSPNFHVGMDEVNIGGHPLTRAALKTQTRGDLLADYVQFLHGVVTANGKRMWMWGDALLRNPDMIEKVPEDVVICNWQYTPDASASTTQFFLDAGFDVMLCSALISHDQPLFPGESFAVPNIRTLQKQQSLTGRGNVLGHLNTIWTPIRYIADSLWIGVDLAAAILSGGPDVNASITVRRFGQNFYGLDDVSSEQFAQAAEILIDHSPIREEWIAIAKLQPLTPQLLARISTIATGWSRARHLVLQAEPHVRQHAPEYAAFLLLVEVLNHAYDAAFKMADLNTAPAVLRKILLRGEGLLELIDQNWDRERFAGDVRKYSSSMGSLPDDHLIPVFSTGLAAIKSRIATLVGANVACEEIADAAEVASAF